MNQLRGILLDVDGTLVASNSAHSSAWIDALAEKGIKVPFDKVRRLIGMGGDKLLPAVAGIVGDSPEGKQISKRREQIFADRYLPSLHPTKGARELLNRLHDEGLKLAVATSAKESELNVLLRICGADQFIQTKTSSDDANNSKPDPDIIHAALKRSGLQATDVLMLGDTPYDVEAAARAGVGVIALRCGGWNDAGLAGAFAIYEDPADLLAHFDSSPLAQPAKSLAL